jgi:hypothetical protein
VELLMRGSIRIRTGLGWAGSWSKADAHRVGPRRVFCRLDSQRSLWPAGWVADSPLSAFLVWDAFFQAFPSPLQFLCPFFLCLKPSWRLFENLHFFGKIAFGIDLGKSFLFCFLFKHYFL